MRKIILTTAAVLSVAWVEAEEKAAIADLIMEVEAPDVEFNVTPPSNNIVLMVMPDENGKYLKANIVRKNGESTHSNTGLRTSADEDMVYIAFTFPGGLSQYSTVKVQTVDNTNGSTTFKLKNKGMKTSDGSYTGPEAISYKLVKLTNGPGSQTKNYDNIGENLSTSPTYYSATSNDDRLCAALPANSELVYGISFSGANGYLFGNNGTIDGTVVPHEVYEDTLTFTFTSP
jgi:hypothetical protein